MPFLPSIDKEDKVPHVLSKFNTGTGKPLLEYHEALLRGNSPFTIQQRELMAAFVSAANACRYCYGAHEAAAKQFGVKNEVFDSLKEAIEDSAVDERLKPILLYIKKLTLTPSQMLQSDADAVLSAGWDERALFDAVQICCLYNFMNRFVEGLGLTPIPDQFEIEGKLIKEGGYAGMIKAFGIK